MDVEMIVPMQQIWETRQPQSFGEAGSTEFMQLLLAQLRHQNPLEPMGDSEMLSQFAQLNALDELKAIAGSLESIGDRIQLGDAIALVGRQVEVRTPKGEIQSIGDRIQLGDAIALVGRQVEVRTPKGEIHKGAVEGAARQGEEVLITIDREKKC